MTVRNTLLAAVAAIATTACLAPTHFAGSAKVLNGPRGCWDQCQAWGMDLAGMVKMGEYSDGCICQVRPPPPLPAQEGAPRSEATPRLDGPAVAGVWMQMQAAAAAAAQQRAMDQQRRWSGSGGGPSYGPGHPLWR